MQVTHTANSPILLALLAIMNVTDVCIKVYYNTVF